MIDGIPWRYDVELALMAAIPVPKLPADKVVAPRPISRLVMNTMCCRQTAQGYLVREAPMLHQAITRPVLEGPCR